MNCNYTVRAARCDHRRSADEIYRTLARITAPLTRSWERLERARRIVIKFNMTQPDTARFAGRRQELVDEDVIRAVPTGVLGVYPGQRRRTAGRVPVSA